MRVKKSRRFLLLRGCTKNANPGVNLWINFWNLPKIFVMIPDTKPTILPIPLAIRFITGVMNLRIPFTAPATSSSNGESDFSISQIGPVTADTSSWREPLRMSRTGFMVLKSSLATELSGLRISESVVFISFMIALTPLIPITISIIIWEMFMIAPSAPPNILPIPPRSLSTRPGPFFLPSASSIEVVTIRFSSSADSIAASLLLTFASTTWVNSWCWRTSWVCWALSLLASSWLPRTVSFFISSTALTICVVFSSCFLSDSCWASMNWLNATSVCSFGRGGAFHDVSLADAVGLITVCVDSPPQLPSATPGLITRLPSSVVSWATVVSPDLPFLSYCFKIWSRSSFMSLSNEGVLPVIASSTWRCSFNPGFWASSFALIRALVLSNDDINPAPNAVFLNLFVIFLKNSPLFHHFEIFSAAPLRNLVTLLNVCLNQPTASLSFVITKRPVRSASPMIVLPILVSLNFSNLPFSHLAVPLAILSILSRAITAMFLIRVPTSLATVVVTEATSTIPEPILLTPSIVPIACLVIRCLIKLNTGLMNAFAFVITFVMITEIPVSNGANRFFSIPLPPDKSLPNKPLPDFFFSLRSSIPETDARKRALSFWSLIREISIMIACLSLEPSPSSSALSINDNTRFICALSSSDIFSPLPIATALFKDPRKDLSMKPSDWSAIRALVSCILFLAESIIWSVDELINECIALPILPEPYNPKREELPTSLIERLWILPSIGFDTYTLPWPSVPTTFMKWLLPSAVPNAAPEPSTVIGLVADAERSVILFTLPATKGWPSRPEAFMKSSALIPFIGS